jgi:hypothetical protein
MSPFLQKQSTSTLTSLLCVSSVLTVLTALGCQGPQRFTDTEDRSYIAECEDKTCTYRPAAPASSEGTTTPSAPAPNAPKLTLRSTGHLLAICEGEKAKGTACRAVTCTDSCPTDPAGNKTTCQRGLCVNEGAEITNEDALLLCIAGTGTQRSAKQAGRMALARTCGTPCVVPAACRQP